VPVPVVITQALRFTSDLTMRGLFGVQTSVTVGLDVGAGFAWVPGTGPFDPGQLEGIGYVRPTGTWDGDTSNSGSVLQTIINKLGGDPSATTWLVGGQLKFILLNIHYQPEMYGLVGADLELHLGYVKAQATWNINQCNISGTVKVGIEGQLNALVTLGPDQQTIDTPLQIGYDWPVFSGQIPFIGVGCPGSPTPGGGSPPPITPPPGPSPSPQPSPGNSPPPPPPPPPQGYFVYHVHGSCTGNVCGIHERTGPGFAYPIVGSKGEGSEVDIVCQTSGDLVTGTIGGSSAIWDRLTDGYYVADLFIDTPGVGVFSDPPIPHC
jgi:hypothetical protein